MSDSQPNFQKDVTAQYADTKDLTIEIQNTDNEYIYLCSTTRSYWAPVAVAKSKDNKVTFPNLGKGCIYMPVCYNQMGEAQLLSEPFKFDWHGNVQKITPDFDNTVTAKLYRKGPLLEYAWKMAILMENGEFEASNDPTFRSKVSVGKVYTPADQAGEIIIPDSIGEYRYWRYIQRGDEAKCYLGELTFYNNDENITHKGLPIGNYDKNACNTFEDGRRAFDGDVLTPVSFTRDGEAWIGLDFGKPISINVLQYVPRSDGDMIEPGDEYEMLYWHKGQWISLGRKIATTVSLTYDNVPTGTIYILLDKTKGQSERIFLLNERGEQEWW